MSVIAAIAPLLEKGYTIHAVTSKAEFPISNEKLIWHRTNLLDAGETEDLLKATRPTYHAK